MGTQTIFPFLSVAQNLELAGLVWNPEIGDEVAHKVNAGSISVLVDPRAAPLDELRTTYLWLPNTEQLLAQLAARQAILAHAGLELSEKAIGYKTVIEAPTGIIEVMSETLRSALAQGLCSLLLKKAGHLVN